MEDGTLVPAACAGKADLPASRAACRAAIDHLRGEIDAIKAQIAAADLERQAKRGKMDPRCVTTMITEAERHIAENQTQANHQKVLRTIQGAGERGLTKSELTRRTQFLELRQREEILLTLTEAGEIELCKRPSDTKPATVYRAVAA